MPGVLANVGMINGCRLPQWGRKQHHAVHAQDPCDLPQHVIGIGKVLYHFAEDDDVDLSIVKRQAFAVADYHVCGRSSRSQALTRKGDAFWLGLEPHYNVGDVRQEVGQRAISAAHVKDERRRTPSRLPHEKAVPGAQTGMVRQYSRPGELPPVICATVTVLCECRAAEVRRRRRDRPAGCVLSGQRR